MFFNPLMPIKSFFSMKVFKDVQLSTLFRFLDPRVYHSGFTVYNFAQSTNAAKLILACCQQNVFKLFKTSTFVHALRFLCRKKSLASSYYPSRDEERSTIRCCGRVLSILGLAYLRDLRTRFHRAEKNSFLSAENKSSYGRDLSDAFHNTFFAKCNNCEENLFEQAGMQWFSVTYHYFFRQPCRVHEVSLHRSRSYKKNTA